MKRRVCIAIVIMGLSGLVAEIMLLRELLIVFSGNELSIGVILANWLILEACGICPYHTPLFFVSPFCTVSDTKPEKYLRRIDRGEHRTFTDLLLIFSRPSAHKHTPRRVVHVQLPDIFSLFGP